MKKGHILQKKAKIDEKLEKTYFLDFWWESMEECRKKAKMMNKGHILLKKAIIDGK